MKLKDLENKVEGLNKLLNFPLTTFEGGKWAINHLHINSQYAGVELVQTVNEGGAVQSISRGGFVSKPELSRQIGCMYEGVKLQKLTAS